MDLAQVFLAPQSASQRQYEALRAYFVERLPGPEVARRFGYTPGSVHQLVHQFRRQPSRTFFVEATRPGAKADETVRRHIIQLRKQNQSVYDISEALKKEGKSRTPAAVAAVLQQEALPNCRGAATANGRPARSRPPPTGRTCAS